MKLKPIHKTILLLGVYALFGVLLRFVRVSDAGWNLDFQQAPEVFGSLFLIFGISLVFHFLAEIIQEKKLQKSNPEAKIIKKSYANTLVSALILFMVINYTLGGGQYLTLILATLITMTARFFLRFRGLPIFNPVALGLVITFLLAKLIPALPDPFISWWGTSYQLHLLGENVIYHFSLALFFVLVWIFFGLYKWRKYPILLTFLGGHLIFQLLFLALGNIEASFFEFTFTDATTYFFASVMLVEPRTSPMVKKQQIIYGLVAVLAFNLLFFFRDYLPISTSIFYLIAILAGNFYFLMAKRSLLKARPPQA